MKMPAFLKIAVLFVMIFSLSGCEFYKKKQTEMRTVTDQLGRQVTIPKTIKKVAALRHFGGKIVYALGKQDLLVERSIYGQEALALTGWMKNLQVCPGW